MTNDGIHRREFVKGAAAIGASGFVAGSALGAMTKPNRDTLRVGVVGCGGRGTGAMLQALKADPNAMLWSAGEAVGGRIEASIGRVQAGLDAHAEEGGDPAGTIEVPADRMHVGFDAYKRVIDECDVVLLTTPPAFRPQQMAAAIDAGKHVFCEKPVAVDAPGVRSVLQSARKAKQSGLAVMSGFCWRYQDQCRETMAKLHGGGVGDLHTIQTTYNTTGWVRPNPMQDGWSETEFQLRNWQYFTPLSGDHVVEQAVHAIDWIAWAMKDVPPVRCWAVGGRQTRPDTPETGNVYDHFGVTFEYANGQRAYHMCRHWPNTPSDNSAYFLGSAGRCTMQPWTGQHVIEGDQPWRGNAPGNDMYQREHDVLFNSIRDGNPVNDGVSMSYSTLMAIMARMAAYTGEVVTWQQARDSQENLNPDPFTFGDRPRPSIAVPGVTKFA
ncbi:MAG: gfo/Idh/MocA family oxidoreductase [Phycisphaera sp.]|nr:MAG: gfo/Idh/MocA family oxidoreductase [Phycisphaera sp.]